MNHRSRKLRDSADGEAWSAYAPGYEVSDRGRVRHATYVDRNGHSRKPRIVLATAQAEGWYLRVYLGHGRATRKRAYVHQLVATVFLGPRPENFVVNHRNGNKQDNRVDNLEWTTQAENCRHARDAGLTPVGEGRGDAKLREQDVRKIRALFAGGMNYSQISALYPVQRACIRKVVLRESWRHVEP